MGLTWTRPAAKLSGIVCFSWGFSGEHYVRTYHHDTKANYGSVNVSVTDAEDATRLVCPDQRITYGGGNSAADNDPDPGIIGTVPMKVVSDGINPVVISVGPNQTYAHVSGMEITSHQMCVRRCGPGERMESGHRRRLRNFMNTVAVALAALPDGYVLPEKGLTQARSAEKLKYREKRGKLETWKLEIYPFVSFDAGGRKTEED